MIKENIVIIGASGHASVVIDIIEQENKYNILGLIDSYKPKDTTLFNYKVLGSESYIEHLIKTKQIIGGIVAIGDNATRTNMVNTIAALNPNFKFVTAIHPSAITGKGVVIGAGSVVVAGTVINSNTTIETHCIINTKASIGHDCYIESFSSVAPGATLGGGITIKTGAIICLGATLLGQLKIGAHALVGAGAVATQNVPDNTIVMGVPAKPIRTRKHNESYL